MIEIRDMQFLVALARHRHFAKAARDCGISQPAFSVRIRALEDRFGVSIVRRGNRFQGFTEHGDLLVHRARRILEQTRALEQEVRSASGNVSGMLSMGVIPTALAYASRLCIHLHKTVPGVIVRIESTTSLLIQQRIDEGTLDAGITYQDGVSPDLVTVTPLYDERYVLLLPESMAQGRGQSISWREAAEIPMSMLQPEMRNRRILDRMFDEVGRHPRVIAETNNFTTSLVMAREGLAATIVPEVLMSALGDLGGVRVVRLIEPELTKAICLVTPSRSPGLPVTEALKRSVAQFS
ncbi:MAG: DNA-binding transcriptional LysR family regulator [Paracoccaceae bacterium]|jgi:DNA-binding transcriptional LysR family regulator